MTGALELNSLKKTHNQKFKDLEDASSNISALVSTNNNLKIALMKAMIEKEELIIKKNGLTDNITRLQQHIENMENESDIMLRDDDVDCVRERYSITQQMSLISKIQEARCRLLKYGRPPQLY